MDEIAPHRDAIGEDGLSLQERVFVDALIGPARGKIRAAARLSGLGKSETKAWLVVQRPRVQDAIARKLAELKATPEWAKATLIDLASASMANFLSIDSKGIARTNFRKAAAAGALGQIKKFKRKKTKYGVQIEIELHDRISALGFLLRFHGILKDGEKSPANDGFTVPDPEMAAAEIPHGAIPGLVPPGEVQDDPCGPAVGQDGIIREAEKNS